MPAKPPTKRRARTGATTKTRSPQRGKGAKQKRRKPPAKKAVKRKAPKRKKAAAKRSSKPKLKKQKLIAPRKKPPKRKKRKKSPEQPSEPTSEELIEREVMQREELREDWKTIDPFSDLDIEVSSGGALDEDEDKWEIDPYGDPDAPGFDRFKDLPQGMDVHDYIAWLAEEYDLDMGQLYEEYFGDGDS